MSGARRAGAAEREADLARIEVQRAKVEEETARRALREAETNNKAFQEALSGAEAARKAAQVAFAVPGIERVQSGPPTTQVRYFRRKEEGDAKTIASVLRRQGVKDAEARYVAGYEDARNIRPLAYEIRLAAGEPRRP